MKQLLRLILLLGITLLLSGKLSAQIPFLRVNSMPSWSTNHAYSNFLFNDTIMIWGTAFGGTPPYNDSIKIDGIWIPNSSMYADPYPVTDPACYIYGHLFARRVVFYSCGFHTIEVKVTDAIGVTQVSQSTILIHNNPPFNVLVDMRIERGLLYLFKKCILYQDKCFWSGYDNSTTMNVTPYEFASSAGAILCFEENNHIYTNDTMVDPFAEMLHKGMRYLFEGAAQDPIFNHDDGTGYKISDLFTSTCTGSGFCTSGNGKGSYIFPSTGADFTYANSFGMMAVVLSQADTIDAENHLIENGCFHNWTYLEFIRDALDLTYFYQGDFGSRGGWGYTLFNSGYFDGSLEQWPPLYMAAIQSRLGFSSPDWIKTNVNYLYSLLTSADGGCGYTSGLWNVNAGKTGGMLASYAWTGKLINDGDIQATDALHYLEGKYFQLGSYSDDGGWYGCFYPMYAVKKGLALQNIQYITINGQPRDWYKDMVGWLTGGQLWTLPSTLLTGNRSPNYCYGQHADGSWKDTYFNNSTVLSTIHAILILSPNIFNVPIPSPTPVNGICHGDSIQITCTTGTSYEWFSNPNGYYSTVQNPYVNPDSTTVYFAFVYDTIGCISEVDSVRIIIWPFSDPQPYYNNPACTGDSLKLFSQPGQIHNWTGPAGFSSLAQNPVIPIINSANTGWYYIIMNDTMGCYAIDSLYVEVHDPPVVVVSANNPVCTNDSLLLQATGGESYLWAGPQGFSSALSDPVIHGFQLTMNGNYYVTVTNEAGCVSIDSITISGLVSPVALASSNTPLCEGDTLVLHAEGGTAYSWTGPLNYNAEVPDTSLVNIVPGQSGQYWVVVSDFNNCKDTAFLDVLIRPAPQIINPQLIQPSCHGDTNGVIQFTVIGGGPFTYVWDCCPAVNAPFITGLSAGIYQVTITNIEGCEKIQSFTLPEPQPFTVTEQIFPDTCRNLPMGAIFLTGIIGQNPPYTFTWSNGHTTQDISNLYVGNYQVTITDMNGCDAVYNYDVNFLSDPYVEIIPDTTSICKGDTVGLEASGSLTYLWAPALVLSQTTGNTVLAFPDQSTTVSVVGTDIYHCHDTAGSFIKVIPLPELNLGEDLWVPFGQQTTLDAPYGYDHYLWSTGSTGMSIIIADTGLYWLTIWNSICQNTDSLRILEITDIWVPNAFTPDQNGKNDYFSAVCMSCTEIETEIFDRWGEIVFHSNALDARWDGTFKGSLCPMGVYVYKITFHKPSPQNYEGKGILKGIVVLLR